MTVMGDWAEGYFKAKGLTPGKDFGWTPSPGHRGIVHHARLILLACRWAPRTATPRCRWLTLAASREGQDAFNPKKGSIPSRIDGDRSLYDNYQKSAMDSFRNDTIVPSVTHGAAASEVAGNDPGYDGDLRLRFRRRQGDGFRRRRRSTSVSGNIRRRQGRHAGRRTDAGRRGRTLDVGPVPGGHGRSVPSRLLPLSLSHYLLHAHEEL